ncbi:MAG: peptidoglycan-binding protein [Clostridia bacterium]|nr:peptidoglycan-binding protein [Clostridia bacterium]
MKHRKLPYIHILPRILIGIIVIGALIALIYVPLIARDVFTINSVADISKPLSSGDPTTLPPTPTPLPTFTPTPAPTLAPSNGPTTPPSDVVVLSVYTTLRLGDDNASVINLQQRLTDLGYLDSDMPDSIYNESIASAVVLFQRACEMPQTGIADSATQTSLYADHAQTYRIKRSDTGTDVLRLQQRLYELGYYTDRINGYFGPNTEQAVMRFQAVNGLTVSGELDYDAWVILYSDDAQPLPALPTDTPSPKPTQRPASNQTAKATSKNAGKATQKATAKATPKATAKATSKVTAKATSKNGTKPTSKATVKATPKPTEKKASSGKKTYSSLVAAAQDQLGKPYEWSAEGPDSFDCSGLVYYCLKQSGHNVSRRNASGFSQTKSWTLITSMKDLKAGDLVFFKSDSSNSVKHTGICISNGTMIHASSSKGKVAKSSLHQDYWERNFVCGRRPS